MHSRIAQPVASSKMASRRMMANLLQAYGRITPVATSHSALTSIAASLIATRRFGANHILAGRSIFQLKAAAVEAPDAATAEPIELPTSDESDKLLRIRHSVSYKHGTQLLMAYGCIQKACHGKVPHPHL